MLILKIILKKKLGKYRAYDWHFSDITEITTKFFAVALVFIKAVITSSIQVINLMKKLKTY